MEEDRFHLDDLKLYTHLNGFMEYNRIEFVELDEEHCILKHEINKDSMNINGNAHGGLLMTMIDIAVSTVIRKNGENCATNSFNINFLRPAHGTVYAKAEFIKRGNRINVMHGWCYNDDGVILCDAVANMCKID